MTLVVLLLVPILSGASADVLAFCSAAIAACVIGAALIIRADIRSQRVPYVRPPRDPGRRDAR